MAHAITNGVSITVDTAYQQGQSNPSAAQFLFTYRITIENQRGVAIKLLSRHWHIADSNGSMREVKGDGVVGQQPVIQPGQQYQYVSACNLRSEIGKMWGTYLMESRPGGTTFLVNIPEFSMIAPFRVN